MTVLDEQTYLARQLDLHGLGAGLPVAVADAVVPVGGLRIHVREWGRRSSHPVVFLHGGGGCARDWDAICAALSGRRHCVAVDQRGHGDSDWSPGGDYRLDAFSADLEALGEACGWRTVRLVGFSMGGASALAAAASLQARCTGLVLVEAAPRLREHPEVDRLRRRLVEPKRYASLDDASRRGDVDRELARAYQARRLRQGADGLWEAKHDPRLLNGAGTRETADEREAALWRAVAAVRCPVLVVRGGKSPLLPRETAATLVSRFAAAQLVEIAELPHRVSVDGTPQLVAAIESFFAAHDDD